MSGQSRDNEMKPGVGDDPLSTGSCRADPFSADPFSAAADPYPPGQRAGRGLAAGAHDCQCAGPSLTRRQALAGVGALALLPALAHGAPVPVPCVHTTQKPQPCRHKFCRHYAGEGDYHGR